MKKLITILAMLMMVLSIHASDPVVLFGLLSPAASYSGSMESESIDVDFLNHDTITGLIATAELERKDITIEKLLSDKIFTSSKALIDAGMIGLSLEDAGAIGTDGTVIITPDMSSMSSLEGSITVEYDDFKMLYSIGARTESITLDGKVTVSIDLSDESLLYLSVRTDDFLFNSDSSYSNSSAGIRIFFEYDKVGQWLSYMGYDFDELRYMTAYMLLDIPELQEAGIDATSPETVIFSLEEIKALDILDAVAFALTADSAEGIDTMRMASMALKPVLYIDEKEAEDINLKALMDTALDVAYVFSDIM